jgi:hypothetical protein
MYGRLCAEAAAYDTGSVHSGSVHKRPALHTATQHSTEPLCAGSAIVGPLRGAYRGAMC